MNAAHPQDRKFRLTSCETKGPKEYCKLHLFTWLCMGSAHRIANIGCAPSLSACQQGRFFPAARSSPCLQSSSSPHGFRLVRLSNHRFYFDRQLTLASHDPCISTGTKMPGGMVTPVSCPDQILRPSKLMRHCRYPWASRPSPSTRVTMPRRSQSARLCRAKARRDCRWSEGDGGSPAKKCVQF